VQAQERGRGSKNAQNCKILSLNKARAAREVIFITQTSRVFAKELLIIELRAALSLS
jgi:hypothetical protein